MPIEIPVNKSLLPYLDMQKVEYAICEGKAHVESLTVIAVEPNVNTMVSLMVAAEKRGADSWCSFRGDGTIFLKETA